MFSMNIPDSPDENKEKQESKKILKDNLPKAGKWALMKLLKTVAYPTVVLQLLKKWYTPFQIKMLFQEMNNWLRVNSIIWNPLYYDSGKWELEFKASSAWLWNGYDFINSHFDEWRMMISKLTVDSIIYFFDIDDPAVNSESDNDVLTPDWYLVPMSFDHFVHMWKKSVSEIIEYWALREITYWDALTNASQQHLIWDARDLWIIDKQVFQVTPKWNWLIYLESPWWDKSDPVDDSQVEWNQGNWWFIPA